MSLIMDVINKAGAGESRNMPHSGMSESKEEMNQKSLWTVPSERFFLSSSKKEQPRGWSLRFIGIVLLILALAFLGFWLQQKRQETQPLPAPASFQQPMPSEVVSVKNPGPVIESMDGMPFFRQVELQGILAGKDKSLCIISGRIFKEQDSVEGYRIESIGSQEVMLKSPQGETVPLALKR
ncbi:MAG: hypothetical protein H6757_01400 [Candidatus Omnitrophica bacterium]|nr:hypothetical protein [Candidatus Omnitrophota bacterium]